MNEPWRIAKGLHHGYQLKHDFDGGYWYATWPGMDDKLDFAGVSEWKELTKARRAIAYESQALHILEESKEPSVKLSILSYAEYLDYKDLCGMIDELILIRDAPKQRHNGALKPRRMKNASNITTRERFSTLEQRKIYEYSDDPDSIRRRDWLRRKKHSAEST